MFSFQFSVLGKALRRTYFSFTLTKSTEFRLIYRTLVYINIIWENLFRYTTQFMFIYSHTHTPTYIYTLYIYIYTLYIYIYIRNTHEWEKNMYTGWSKSPCAPNGYNKECGCTETIRSLCIYIYIYTYTHTHTNFGKLYLAFGLIN